MTLVVTIFVGLGAVLLISGIEDSPLQDTFRSVIAGNPTAAAPPRGAAAGGSAAGGGAAGSSAGA